MNTYDVGDVARLRGTFTDDEDAPQDPDTVTIRVKRPGGTESDVTPVVREGTGLYRADVDLDASGTWHYRVRGTGTHAGSGEGTFQVRPSAFA